MNSTKGRSLTRGAAHWFQTGKEAMARRNWDYALECLDQAIRLQPDELDYRIQKHRASRRKFARTGEVSKVASVRLAAIRSRLMTAQLKQDWLAVDKFAEAGLSLNPWDAEFFAHVARAATTAGRIKIARYAWTSAVKIDKENAEYFRAFGSLLQANGEYDLAKSCFERIGEIDPSGRIAKELISAVEVDSLIDTHGYGGASSTHDVKMESNIEEAITIEEPDDEVDLISNRELHDMLVNAVTLAEQHIKHGRLCSAAESYKQAADLAPQNESVRIRMEDVELAMLRREATDAEKEARSDPSSEVLRAAAIDRLTILTDRELEVFESRAKKDPENLLIAFQLADHYRRAAQFQQAVPLFQRAMTDQELKAEALIGLGECLIRIERASQGHKHLMEALKVVNSEEKPNAFKLAHYWLARLYEVQNYFEQAEAHYAEILKVDSGFRDVGPRLANIRS